MWDITEAEGKLLGCGIKTLSKKLTWAPIEGLLFKTISSHCTICPSKVFSKLKKKTTQFKAVLKYSLLYAQK